MRRLSQLYVPFVVTVLALGAAGCGANSPKPSPVAKSTTRSSNREPRLPAAARTPSRSASQIAVSHYLDLLGYAGSTGDTKALNKFGAEDCASCSAVVKKIKSVYDAGGRIEGDGFALLKVERIKKRADVFDLTVVIDSSKQVTVSMRGMSPTTAAPEQIPAHFDVGWSSGKPRVLQWNRVQR